MHVVWSEGLTVRWRSVVLVVMFALSACGSGSASGKAELGRWCTSQASLVEVPSVQFARPTKDEQLALIDRYVTAYEDLSTGPKDVPAAVLADYSKMRDMMFRVRARVEGGELLSSFLEGDADIAELVRAGESIDTQPVAGCPPVSSIGGTDSLSGQIGFPPVETAAK